MVFEVEINYACINSKKIKMAGDACVNFGCDDLWIDTCINFNFEHHKYKACCTCKHGDKGIALAFLLTNFWDHPSPLSCLYGHAMTFIFRFCLPTWGCKMHVSGKILAQFSISRHSFSQEQPFPRKGLSPGGEFPKEVLCTGVAFPMFEKYRKSSGMMLDFLATIWMLDGQIYMYFGKASGEEGLD